MPETDIFLLPKALFEFETANIERIFLPSIKIVPATLVKITLVPIYITCTEAEKF
jgi:hypothetical protein